MVSRKSGMSDDLWMRQGYERFLVSVIVPTYNRSDLLIEAMNSVFAQTYRPIELIVVDDGSTDDTKQVVQDWGNKNVSDDKFKLSYLHQNNAGVSVARNLGLVNSQGEFIQFLDSDDLLLPEKLNTHVKKLIEYKNIDVVYSALYVEEFGKKSVQYPPDLETNPVPSEAVSGGLSTMSAVYRRAVLVAAGPWDEEICWTEDWEYAARVMVYVRGAKLQEGVHAVYRYGSHDRLSIDRYYGEKNLISGLRAIRLIAKTIRETEGQINSKAEKLLLDTCLSLGKMGLKAGMGRVARQAIKCGKDISKKNCLIQYCVLYLLSYMPKTVVGGIAKVYSRFRGQ
jgi:glycosyltransferase involved in cell wall biosynthesis